MQVSNKQILVWDETVEELARKRSRIIGVDYDDLIQEGRMAVLLAYLGDYQPCELDIKNAMRRYIRNQKSNKLTTYEIRKI